MNTKEILTIVALAALGLCLLCSLAKAAMKKGDKSKKHCDKACGAFVFLAIILLAVSQLLGREKEKYDSTDGCLPSSNDGCETCKCAVPLDWEAPSGCGKFCNYKDYCPDEDDPNKNKNSNKFCRLPARKNKCAGDLDFICSSTGGPVEGNVYPIHITGTVSGTYDKDPKAECGCICESKYKGDHCQTFKRCPKCKCSTPYIWPFNGCNIDCNERCGGVDSPCCHLPNYSPTPASTIMAK